MIISISGPDGSGKSSVAKQLAKNLSTNRRVKTFHIDKYFLLQPFISQSKKKITKNNTFSYDQKPFFLKSIVLLALLDSWVYFFYLKTFSLLGHVVICDRYFYDKLVGFNLHGYSNEFLNKVFLKVIPKPNYAFLLDIRPDRSALRETGDTHDALFHKKIGNWYSKLFKYILVEKLDANEEIDNLAENIVWRTKKAIVTTHVYADGPSQALVEYLKIKNIGKLVFIEHPLFPKTANFDSSISIFSGKDRTKIVRSGFNFFFTPLLTIYWSFLNGYKSDIFIGANSLNAFCGIVLRKLGLVRRTIYYVVDYQPNRFNNKLLNNLFHKIEFLSAKFSDETWNLSKNMNKAREKLHGVKLGNQKIVPMGAWISKINTITFEKCNKNQGVFVGHITENRGLQLVILALPMIIKELTDFRLCVIGDGPYLQELKKLAADLKVEDKIEFKGFINKHSDLEKIVAESSLAFATYKPDKSSFSYYADPGKVKLYLSCGVPVVMTEVSYIAKDLEKNNFGIVVDYDVTELSNSLINLFKKPELLEVMRENSVQFGKQFDWNTIFSKLGL